MDVCQSLRISEKTALLAVFCKDISAMVHTEEPLCFEHIMDVTELRLKSTAQLLQTLEAEYGPFSKLCSGLDAYIVSACELVDIYAPVHTNLIVRELAYAVHFGGMPLDHSLLSRYLAVGLAGNEWKVDETLTRVSREVYRNCLKESSDVDCRLAPVPHLVRCAFVQDDGVFNCLWDAYSKKLHRAPGDGDEHTLAVIGRVCAHHGTHAMTMQVAEFYSRHGFVSVVPFEDFVERFTAPPQTHAELIRMLLHCKLVCPFALLRRAMSMIAIPAAHDLVARVVCGCVSFIRKVMRNKDRVDGVSFKRWLMSYTFYDALDGDAVAGATVLSRRDLKALGAIWISALSWRRAQPVAAAAAAANIRHMELREGVERKCGALVQIGLCLSMLAPIVTLSSVNDPPNQETLVWTFLCRNVSSKQLRMRMLCRWWPHLASPWTHTEIGVGTRASLPSSAVGLLVHMRLYDEMVAIAALARNISVGCKARVSGAYLNVALCRVVVADGRFDALHSLIIAHPPETEYIPRSWLMEIAGGAAAAAAAAAAGGDVGTMLNVYLPLSDVSLEELFRDALRLGLPCLAQATFSGDVSDILAVYIQGGPGGIDRRCHTFCQSLDDKLLLTVDSVYASLVADDAVTLSRLLTLWPPLATEVPSARLWQKLRAVHAPWCLDKQRSLASYGKCPPNVFVAAVRLKRMACLGWLLTVPDLLSEFGRDVHGHSILCESLWRELVTACKALLASHAVSVGRCERACAPKQLKSLLKTLVVVSDVATGPS
jgi:hypothetical protein